jgi:hypothetical protein
MPRTPMGGTSGDTVVTIEAVTLDLELVDPTKKLDVYDAYTGGTHITDLQDPTGAAITYLSLGAGIDSNTGIADFISAAAYTGGDYYLQDQANPTWARILVRPKNLTSLVAASGVSEIKLNGGSPLTGSVNITTSALVAIGLAPLASPTFTGTVSGITKSMVGLANVNNTSDAAKPVSDATQLVLDSKTSTTDVSGMLTGYATIDTSTPTIRQLSDGTWPIRATKSNDPTQSVFWVGYSGLAAGPSIGGTGMVADVDVYLQ